MTTPTDIILYCTVWPLNIEFVDEKKNRSLVFSGSRKMLTLGATVQWETREVSLSTGNVISPVGIFLSPLDTNDGFYLSHMGNNNGNPNLVCVAQKRCNSLRHHRLIKLSMFSAQDAIIVNFAIFEG